jgi:hypothetical protein
MLILIFKIIIKFIYHKVKVLIMMKNDFWFKEKMLQLFCINKLWAMNILDLNSKILIEVNILMN